MEEERVGRKNNLGNTLTDIKEVYLFFQNLKAILILKPKIIILGHGCCNICKYNLYYSSSTQDGARKNVMIVVHGFYILYGAILY